MIKKIIHILDKKYIEYIILTFILVLGFIIRLYRINNPIADWHSWRQADTASVTKIYVENGINLFYPRYYDISSIQTGIFNPNGYRMVEFPIFNAIHALLFENFHRFSLEVWGRLLTISCAIITAFFLYLIGYRLMGRLGGILSAAFYLFIPFNIYFTRMILPDPMGVMFAVISTRSFLEFFYKDKLRFFITSAVFFALALLIKPYLGFYLFPIVYLAVKKYGLKGFFRNKNIILGTVAFVFIAFSPFVFWRMWEAKFPEGIPFYTWTFNGNHIRFRPSFWYWIFGERLSHLILGSLGLIPFVFGVLNTRYEPIKNKNYFIHSLLAGALFYLILVASANTMHDYYQILIIPVVALTLAAGSIYLWSQKVFNILFTRLVLIFSVGVMLITGWKQIVGNYNINHPEILAAGAVIDKITPKDALVIAPYNGDTAFLYATNRKGWPAVDDSFDNLINKGASFYVSVNLNDNDTKMLESKFKTVVKTDKYIIINLGEKLNK